MEEISYVVANDIHCIRFVLLLVFGAALYGLVTELSEGMRASRIGHQHHSNQGRRP